MATRHAAVGGRIEVPVQLSKGDPVLPSAPGLGLLDSDQCTGPGNLMASFHAVKPSTEMHAEATMIIFNAALLLLGCNKVLTSIA